MVFVKKVFQYYLRSEAKLHWGKHHLRAMMANPCIHLFMLFYLFLWK